MKKLTDRKLMKLLSKVPIEVDYPLLDGKCGEALVTLTEDIILEFSFDYHTETIHFARQTYNDPEELELETTFSGFEYRLLEEDELYYLSEEMRNEVAKFFKDYIKHDLTEHIESVYISK